jgi:hypothetical protein
MRLYLQPAGGGGAVCEFSWSLGGIAVYHFFLHAPFFGRPRSDVKSGT